MTLTKNLLPNNRATINQVAPITQTPTFSHKKIRQNKALLTHTPTILTMTPPNKEAHPSITHHRKPNLPNRNHPNIHILPNLTQKSGMLLRRKMSTRVAAIT